MADRQYTASAYTIDFVNHSVLLVYNVKLKKWLQPGGHIKDSELEMPWDAAVRETKEETGVDIQIIGPIFHGRYQPVAVEHYTNSVGDMIDMQYLAVPVTDSKNIKDNVIWQDIFTIDFNSDITEEIREDIKTLYRQYNHTKWEVDIVASVKIGRVNHLIQQEISIILMEEIKDEDLKFVTITGCDTSSDYSYCKVYFTVLDEEKKEVVLEALEKASSFIRGKLAERIDIRHTPELKFIYDTSIEYGEHIEAIIDKIHEDESGDN